MCAAVDGAIGILAIRVSWTVTVCLVFAFAIVMLGAMTLFAFFEWRARYRLRQMNLQAAVREMLNRSSTAGDRRRRPKEEIWRYAQSVRHDQTMETDVEEKKEDRRHLLSRAEWSPALKSSSSSLAKSPLGPFESQQGEECIVSKLS